MLERGDFLLAPRGPDRDREVARGIQHPAAALSAGLQAAGAGGVRAAKGGSPVAYGSLRATLRGLAPCGCDVDSLTPWYKNSLWSIVAASLCDGPPVCLGWDLLLPRTRADHHPCGWLRSGASQFRIERR